MMYRHVQALDHVARGATAWVGQPAAAYAKQLHCAADFVILAYSRPYTGLLCAHITHRHVQAVDHACSQRCGRLGRAACAGMQQHTQELCLYDILHIVKTQGAKLHCCVSARRLLDHAARDATAQIQQPAAAYATQVHGTENLLQ
jgi:hypothetical protein